MCETMVHRGPDDAGYYVGTGVGLGIRRLSIIDLDGGRQPITNEDGTIFVVLNGEIYNYQELRTRLLAKGHRFQTHSDTEVIVHLYEERGLECMTELRGMFAFALWDTRQRRLLLARDRLGKKPLHYTQLSDRLLFSSEIKGILADSEVSRSIDALALDQYLTFEYIPGERTIYRAVRRLLPGHRLVWQEGTLRIDPYWHLDPTPLEGRPQQEWLSLLHDELREAVRLRLRSDVPLGVLLSGGLDSSTVVALMREVTGGEIQSFSIGFEDSSYDELPYARLVARRFETRHREFTVRPDAARLIDRLTQHFDEPFADVSAIPTFLVSQLARQHVTVALGGDGGDELFGGYDPYLAQHLARPYQLLPATVRRYVIQPLVAALRPKPQKKGVINRLKRFVEGTTYPPALGHARWMVFLSAAEKAEAYTSEFQAQLNGTSGYEPVLDAAARYKRLDPIAAAMMVDLVTYLPDDILAKVDRASMANSLEVRAPFLDHKVVELAMQIPSRLKVHHWQGKYLLRKLMQNTLPREVVYKPKQGFSIPVKNWLQAELREALLECLSPARLTRRGIVNVDTVQRWIRHHLSGKENHAHRLWPLMMLELWYERYIDHSADIHSAL
jgi:asparagine synthase (glutamine-hydrolysing)